MLSEPAGLHAIQIGEHCLQAGPGKADESLEAGLDGGDLGGPAVGLGTAALAGQGRGATELEWAEPLSMVDNSTHRNGTPAVGDGQPRRMALS